MVKVRTWPLAAALLLSAGLAFAQGVGPWRAGVDAPRAALDGVKRAMVVRGLGDAELQTLRARTDPIYADIRSLEDKLAPALEASRKRLETLAPTPATKDAPAAAPSADYAKEKVSFDALDADLRSAKAVEVEIEQVNGRIATMRHAIFTRETFSQTYGLFSPSLWIGLAKAAPDQWTAARALGATYAEEVGARASALRLGLLAALALAIAFAYAPLRAMARRLLGSREGVAPHGELQRAAATVWSTLVRAALPAAALFALLRAAEGLGLLGAASDAAARAATVAMFSVIAARALARGFLAPGRPAWRLPRIGDAPAERLARLATLVVAVAAGEKFLERMADALAAPLVVSIALRAVGALVVAAALLRSLGGLALADEAAPDSADRRKPGATARLVALVAATAIALALLTGYVAFAAFLVDQVVWVSGVVAIGFVTTRLVEGAIESIQEPASRAGRIAMSTLGLRRDSLKQWAVLIEGAGRIAIYGIAALLVLAPWGLQSADMLGSLRALAFGVSVGGVTISLGGAAIAAALFALGVAATRGLQRWLDSTYLPQTRLDLGLRNTIRTSVGYVGVLIALTLGLGRLGISLDRLALVAGALSLGVGFGLQAIVANVVSGLILLLERAIRVGDWIVVGTDEGFVRRINVRATEIETFDRATVIVPNSNLVGGVVRNWVRTDRVGRVLIPMLATFESGPEPLRETLIGAARAHPLVLKIPSPLVLFTGFADWGLKLDLICFVDDVETAARVKSDLLFDIHARMARQGLHWPNPAPAWAKVAPPLAASAPAANGAPPRA